MTYFYLNLITMEFNNVYTSTSTNRCIYLLISLSLSLSFYSSPRSLYLSVPVSLKITLPKFLHVLPCQLARSGDRQANPSASSGVLRPRPSAMSWPHTHSNRARCLFLRTLVTQVSLGFHSFHQRIFFELVKAS